MSKVKNPVTGLPMSSPKTQVNSAVPVGPAQFDPKPTQTYAPPAAETTPKYEPRQTYTPPTAETAVHLDSPDYSLKDPGTLTPQGKAYRDSIMARLNGTDPVLTNAQNTANTQASRTNYLTRQQAQEGAAQARFAPGTIQYQRMLDQSMAGANASNLAGQNQVNELARNRNADALSAASGIEKDAYGSAIGERNFQYQTRQDMINREDRQAQQAIENQHWDTTHQDALDAVKRGDAQAAINAIGSQSAKNYLLSILATQGPQGVLAAVPGLFEGGQLKSTYADPNSAEKAQQDAQDWIALIHPEVPKGSPEFDKLVSERLSSSDSAIQKPINDAKEADVVKTIEEKLNLDGYLTDADFTVARQKGTVQNYTNQTLPIDEGARALAGKVVSLNGQQVKVVANGRVTNFGGGHTSYVVVQTPDGRVMYNYNGQLTETPPVTQSGPDAGSAAVYNPETKSLSYVKSSNAGSAMMPRYVRGGL